MTMTAETPQPFDIASLPIGDLAKQARHELGIVEQAVEESKDIIPRALANIDLIDQIRSKPGIIAFLNQTSQSVEILGGVISGEERLYVTSEGYEIRWGTDEDIARQHLRPFIDMGRQRLEDFTTGIGKYGHENKVLVNRLSKLKPRQIFDKFRKALSSPVKVK